MPKLRGTAFLKTKPTFASVLDEGQGNLATFVLAEHSSYLRYNMSISIYTFSVILVYV